MKSKLRRQFEAAAGALTAMNFEDEDKGDGLHKIGGAGIMR